MKNINEIINEIKKVFKPDFSSGLLLYNKKLIYDVPYLGSYCYCISHGGNYHILFSPEKIENIIYSELIRVSFPIHSIIENENLYKEIKDYHDVSFVWSPIHFYEPRENRSDKNDLYEFISYKRIKFTYADLAKYYYKFIIEEELQKAYKNLKTLLCYDQGEEKSYINIKKTVSLLSDIFTNFDDFVAAVNTLKWIIYDNFPKLIFKKEKEKYLVYDLEFL